MLTELQIAFVPREESVSARNEQLAEAAAVWDLERAHAYWSATAKPLSLSVSAVSPLTAAAKGVPQTDVRAVGSHVVMDPTLICKKTRRLRGRLADICKKEPALLKEITKGVSLGTKECQYQFRNRRWNCTTARRSLRKVLMRDTRETGFVNAITAAGVTYAVTRACTMGDLIECSCDKSTKGKNRLGPFARDNSAISSTAASTAAATDGDWVWGGCGDNVNFGYRKSKDFMDAPYRRRSDIKTLVKLHNNDAGRLAVKNFMRTDCKCHGLSGSCAMRTCWRKMPPFRDVGNRLKERFDGAAKVIPSNDGHSFIPEGDTIKPPDRSDLVYSEDSPDFCKPNRKTGSVGTQGRQCNATSPGVEGCELLCCGRGYDTRQVREKINCRCRFKWCCEVTCDTCSFKKAINTCR
ncbi:protein Wnt-6-like [Zootermopsis nevadensis]|uniref:protein Wnt-6-like n=1 Tax=Zootermopsis nevadensis TaxID=136037 RepID=UPI000B8E27AC|nr:protein Wnt-6-like [Zootermopsis nevadensis]